MLDESKVQSYVHDCAVQIHEGPQTHRLRVFFKRHRRLRQNKSLPCFRRRLVTRGDFVEYARTRLPNIGLGYREVSLLRPILFSN